MTPLADWQCIFDKGMVVFMVDCYGIDIFHSLPRSGLVLAGGQTSWRQDDQKAIDPIQ